MELFFVVPTRNFQIREIARLTKIAHTSVKNYLEELRKENLVKKIKGNIYNSYIATSENGLFKIYKQQHLILKLYTSGLIDYLEDKLLPGCIMLFGSGRKGEYTKTSDIDLFVQSSEKPLNLTKFEKILKHEINIFFEENINKLSNELFNNIVNGIILSGYLKIK